MIEQIFNDKNLTLKHKTQLLSQLLLNNTIPLNNFIQYAIYATGSKKATCIEALEFATQIQPKIIDLNTFIFIVESLTAKEPRIKWESAKVICNTSKLFVDHLEMAIENLLQNTNHKGTVVRWSAAKALCSILLLKTSFNKTLIDKIQIINNNEEKASIKKIYEAGIKKIA